MIKLWGLILYYFYFTYKQLKQTICYHGMITIYFLKGNSTLVSHLNKILCMFVCVNSDYFWYSRFLHSFSCVTFTESCHSNNGSPKTIINVLLVKKKDIFSNLHFPFVSSMNKQCASPIFLIFFLRFLRATRQYPGNQQET